MGNMKLLKWIMDQSIYPPYLIGKKIRIIEITTKTIDVLVEEEMVIGIDNGKLELEHHTFNPDECLGHGLNRIFIQFI
jgi:hypothetical protein